MRRGFSLILGWTLLMAATGVSAAPADAGPSLSVVPARATGGFYRLSWTGPPDARYEVQEASDPDFQRPRPVYEGRDTASVVSGKADGDFLYRVRVLGDTGPGPWSEVARVSVVHHDLSRALLFFFTGALVFLALVVVIVRGPREARNP